MSPPQQVRLVVVCWTLDPGSYKPPGAPVVWGESSCGELSGLHIEAPKALRMKKRADWSHPASTAIWGNWSQLSKFVFTLNRGALKISQNQGIFWGFVWFERQDWPQTEWLWSRLRNSNSKQMFFFPETYSVWIVSLSQCYFSCCVFSIGTLSANNTTQKYCKSKRGA